MDKDKRWYRNEHGEMIYETMSKDELVHELVVLAADLDIIEELEAEIQTKKVLEQAAKDEDDTFIPKYNGIAALEALLKDMWMRGYITELEMKNTILSQQ